MKKKDPFNKLLKVLILFVFVGILFGFFKLELILRFVDFRIVKFARLTTYLTLIISTIFSAIILIVMISLGYFVLMLFMSNIKLNTYSDSVIWLVLMYSLNEISKTFIFFFSIPKFISIKTGDDLISLTLNPTYRIQSSYSDVIFILLGIIIYALVLKKRQPTITLFPILASSLALSLSLIFSHFF